MSWDFCEDADDFYARRQLVLDENESLNCLAFAAIHQAKTSDRGVQDFVFCTFRESGSSTAHAVYSRESQILVLSTMSDEQAVQLWAFFNHHTIAVQLVEGPRGAALQFATRWSQATSRPHEVEMRQGLYEVTSPVMPDAAGGTLVVAADNDEAKLNQFLTAFIKECFPEKPTSEAHISNRVRRMITERKGYFWKNLEGQAVSMASVVRESPNTASISLVYTPREHRSCGYGANVVASLSQDQLSRGKRACNLYADLANETSTGVYKRIGYTLIGESVRVRLDTL